MGARVSVFKEDPTKPTVKTSHDTQREAGTKYAVQHGWTIVDYIEDLDVSAGVYTPWERPELRPWLEDRISEWDALIFSKVDRLFRSMKDASDLAHWCEQQSKILVLAEDGLSLDFRESTDEFTRMMSKMILSVLAMGAEMELKSIRRRMRESHEALRGKDRWAGGLPPYGYQIVDHPEAGKTLAVDLKKATALRTAAAMAIAGQSSGQIADRLNSEGFPPPAQAAEWSQSNILRVLRNPACNGVKMQGRGKDHRVVRGPDGLPVRIGEAIFDDAEWAELQAALDKRSQSKERSKNASPLLGIVFCASCGERLYRSVTRRGAVEYVYYKCQRVNGKPACKGYSFKAGYVELAVDEMVRDDLAGLARTERKLIPGEDHTKELERTIKNMSDVRVEKDLGLYDYDGGEEEFRARLTSLAAQRKALEALPHRSDEWVEIPTGETVQDAYVRMTAGERRSLLMSLGVRLDVGPGYLNIVVPEELKEKL